MGRLEDKTAFISGAAGSIGAATARRLVAEGARVVLSDIDAHRLRALADELGVTLLRAMRPGGSLILNSSVVGLTSDPGLAAYATSKTAG